MLHAEFSIGKDFTCGGKEWRCTDIGTRIIVAICVSQITTTRFNTKIGVGSKRILNKTEAETEGWFKGPPYSLDEVVFNEDDFSACAPTSDDQTPLVR